MNLIGPGLHYHVHRSAAATKFRAHGVFFGAKFLNRVGRRKHDNTSEAEFIVIHAVQQKVIVRNPQPIYRQRFIRPFILKDAAGHVGAGLAAISAWPQIGKLNEVAAV